MSAAAIQPDLFDSFLLPYPAGPGFARRSDTSRAAAVSVAPELSTRQRLVYDALRRLGPSTGEEIARHLRLQTYVVLPRLSEMSDSGQVQDSGARRPNTSGRSAVVWRAA